jgi:FK506-binding protein 2
MVLWPILLLSWRLLEQRTVVIGLSAAGWTTRTISCSTPRLPGATTTATTAINHNARHHHNWYTHEAAEAATAAATESPPAAAAARLDDRRVVLRRAMIMILLLVGTTTTTTSCRYAVAAAVLPVNTDGAPTFDDEKFNDNNEKTAVSIRFVDITLASPAESLGVEIGNDPRGNNVRIIRIIDPSRSIRLREGMIVQDVKSAKDLFDRLRNGPYPVTVRFMIDDDDDGPRATTLATTTAPTTMTSTTTNTDFASLSIVTTYRPVQCDAVARRGDVLELVYEAYYEVAGKGGRQEEIMYDASAWRGTGRPYQMVWGSGDMIPGVDQGVLNMCVGEQRILYIPKLLGHGPQSRRLFGIPDNYLGLKWTVELVRVESSNP